MKKGFIVFYNQEKEYGFVEDTLGYQYFFGVRDTEIKPEDLDRDLPVLFELGKDKRNRVCAKSVQKCY